MRVSRPKAAALGCGLHAHPVPAVAQRCRQRIPFALALVQDVGELAFDHQQALVEDGFDFSFPLDVAIVDQEHQALTG